MKVTPEHRQALRRLIETLDATADRDFVQHLIVTSDYRVHTFRPSNACLNAVNRILGRRPVPG
jgi:hypothetical protein